nr:DUF4148 domain-containing protein [Paraburkholderia rhizosphaerae]
MRQVLIASAVLSALVAPAAAFAQQNSSVTRAQVKAELAQLRAAGYRGDTEAGYPNELDAAQARVAAKQAQSAAASSYGPGTAGTSAAGGGATPGLKPIYTGQ